MRSVLFYISGHGFGHASRQIEIINALGAAAPDVEIQVHTSAPRWLFDRTTRVPITYARVECDTGVVQIDSLRLDERETIRRAAAFHDMLEARAIEEARVIERNGAALIIADAPPLACLAASLAGVPAIVVANFTWDWIYDAYAEHLADAPRLLPAIRDAYRRAEAAWRLPMHGGFNTFQTIVDVPLVARHSRQEPATVRNALGLPATRPLALVSFGGFGLESIDYSSVDSGHDLELVLTTDSSSPARLPPWVHTIDESLLYESGFRYEDLVAAVDVVVSKPGYGIISECIANDTALLYTSRGHFAEYDVLVKELPRFLRSGFISQADFFSGRWSDAVRQLRTQPPPVERIETNGAEVVARMIVERVRR